MPVARLSEPFLLAPISPALSLGRSRSPRAGVWRLEELPLSLSCPWSCLPLSNRANAFLSCRTCQHTWNLLAAGISPVLVLEPVSSLLAVLFSSIWARNMPTRISLNFFFTLGCNPRERASRLLGLKRHHHLMPASSPHVSLGTTAGRTLGVVPTCRDPSNSVLRGQVIAKGHLSFHWKLAIHILGSSKDRLCEVF